VFDKEEAIPGYLSISEWKLETILSQGSNHNSFSIAEVFVDGEHLGIYELPATFPVLHEGFLEIRVFPGIYENGIKATPAFYRVCKDHTQNINIIPGDTVYIQPITRYETEVNFLLVEDFEGLHLLNKDLDEDLQTSIRKSDDDPNEGIYSGTVEIDSNHNIFETSSLNSYAIDIGRLAAAYIEIEYKTNIEFGVGIQGENSSTDFTRIYPFILRPSDDWNKVYFNITDYLKESVYSRHRINLAAQWTEDDMVEQGIINLDNIKLLVFGN
jgi:hypothetical protein